MQTLSDKGAREVDTAVDTTQGSVRVTLKPFGCPLNTSISFNIFMKKRWKYKKKYLPALQYASRTLVLSGYKNTPAVVECPPTFKNQHKS